MNERSNLTLTDLAFDLNASFSQRMADYEISTSAGEYEFMGGLFELDDKPKQFWTNIRLKAMRSYRVKRMPKRA